MSPLPLFPAVEQGAAAQHVAIAVDDKLVTYAALHRRALQLSALLDEKEVAPGEPVLVWAERDAESLSALAACVLSGRTLVPVNPEIGERELSHVERNAAPRLALSSHAGAVRGRLPALDVVDLAAVFADAAETSASLPGLDADGRCLVLYTSGTTGLPKGAQLSPRNIASTLDGLADAWQLSAMDTIVHALPVFHAHGLVFGLFGALRLGATLRHVPRFAPDTITAALGAGGAVMYAVPTMYHRLAEAARTDAALCGALRAAKLLVSGSAALPARIHGLMEQLTGQRVAERYGLSETLINTAARADGPRLPGTVGTALPGVTLRLVDDARMPLSTGDVAQLGEVAVRGPNVFSGYLGNPQATAEVLDAEGFFYTGDLGALDADGTLRIVGRKATDLIKTGGFKVGAGEVENALLEHPDVREAAVIGRPDADLGERIVACVVARDETNPPSADALCALVSQLIGKHKRPREVRFVSALPRNAMGKVQKKLIQD
jgi:malonyl-CoA/methylmalonyl-CoA synthetase